MNKFDIGNWLQYPAVAITPGKGKQLAPEFNSRLLLVRWTRASGTPEMVGELEGMILSPFGTPATPRQQFQISKISDYYEFWNIANDGLPYKLQARNLDGSRYGSQLIIWEFKPLIFTAPMGTVNSPWQPQQPVDLSPLVTAIDSGNATLANIQNLQSAMLQQNAPGQTNAFTEINVKEFTGASQNHQVLGQDLQRRSVSIAVPAVDANSNQPNIQPVFVAIGDTNRGQFDDYDYTISPGGSVSLTADEAAQAISCWQNPSTGSTLCNLTTVNT
jgi:hypothetical protein